MSDLLSIDQFIEQIFILESSDKTMAKQLAREAYSQAPDSFILNKYLLELALQENDFESVKLYSERLDIALSHEDYRHLLLEAKFKNRKEAQISCIEKIFELNQGTYQDIKELIGLNMDLEKWDVVESLDSMLIQHLPQEFPEARLLPVQIVSAQQYCSDNNLFYEEIDEACEIKTGKNGEFEYTVPACFLTQLNHVRIIPPNFTVVTKDNHLLYDGLDTNSRTSMTLMPHYRVHSETDKVLLGLPENTKKITDEVILFGGGPNFSHGVNDWMSKLYVLENYPQLSDLPVLISDTMSKPVIELMDIIGVKPKNIQLIDPTVMIEADKVWIPSLTHGFQLISPNYLNWFREKVFKKATPSKKKRLYIGRQNANYRKIINEESLISLLEKFGFDCIAPENMSMQEQIDLFYNCEILITPTGGGTAAISFCSSDAMIIELASPAINLPQYEIVTALQGNKYIKRLGSLTGENSGNLTFDEDYSVNLEEIEKTLDELTTPIK